MQTYSGDSVSLEHKCCRHCNKTIPSDNIFHCPGHCPLLGTLRTPAKAARLRNIVIVSLAHCVGTTVVCEATKGPKTVVVDASYYTKAIGLGFPGVPLEAPSENLRNSFGFPVVPRGSTYGKLKEIFWFSLTPPREHPAKTKGNHYVFLGPPLGAPSENKKKS